MYKNYIYMLALSTNHIRPYNNITFKRVYIKAQGYDEAAEKLYEYVCEHDLDPTNITFLYEEEIEE